MTDISGLIEKYYSWLKDKTAWKEIGKWVEITTPYLDRNNDYIQFYLKKDDEGYFLTDGGAVITGLAEEGCILDSSKRKKLLSIILNGYGVTEKNGELQINATPDNFALRKHSLLQAILAVNDMFYLAAPYVSSIFFEDVRNWLNIRNIRYSENISFMGRSGYARKFDFLITKSLEAPERVIKTINNPVRNAADSIIIDWIDTKDTRPENSKAYALINDIGRNVSSNILDALNNYNITGTLWSARENILEELAI